MLGGNVPWLYGVASLRDLSVSNRDEPRGGEMQLVHFHHLAMTYEPLLWVEARKAELLPVKYFHVVFTVPHDLLELFRFNRRIMYDLLIGQWWKTLQCFSGDPKLLGARLGAICVLHTWDQQIKFHPHVHFIVPAGGIDSNGKWKKSKQNGDFLFDVEHLSAKFSYLFATKLRKLKKQGKIRKFVPRDLIKKPWVVYAKKAFGSPENVVEYLGRYTHRVAISNCRILKVTKHHVTFRWCNRKKGYQTETTTLRGVDFLERFLEHIVPERFRRIRHLGFLSNNNKAKELKRIRKDLNAACIERPVLSRAEILALRFGDRSLLRCRECGEKLVLIESYKKNQRAPPVNDIFGSRKELFWG